MSIPVQETDLYAHPTPRNRFVCPSPFKNLESYGHEKPTDLEGMGGVGARLRCFGIYPNYSLSIETGTTCLAVMCESVTRNHAHPDARQAGAQAFLYH